MRISAHKLMLKAVATSSFLLLLLSSCNEKIDSKILYQVSDDAGVIVTDKVLELSVQSYTAEFSRRFNLDILGSVNTLTPGVLAMKFGVATGRVAGKSEMTCYLKLYLDHDLGLFFPMGTDIANRITTSQTHFFMPRNSGINSADREKLSAGLFDYFRQSFLVSNSFLENGKGFNSNLTYFEHVRNLVEGVDYLDLDLKCSSFDIMESFMDDGIQLMLKYANGSDYTVLRNLLLEDFLKIEFEPEFTIQIAEIMKLVHNLNIALREERLTKLREEANNFEE